MGMTGPLVSETHLQVSAASGRFAVRDSLGSSQGRPLRAAGCVVDPVTRPRIRTAARARQVPKRAKAFPPGKEAWPDTVGSTL